MKSRKYETVVGLFVVASLIALLVMVLIIAQQEGLFQEYVEYRAVFKNVSGLKVGSEVHLAGVTVGNVKSIAINPSGAIVVTFQILQKYADRIRWDSQASIGFQGLLGDKSLDLTAGSTEMAPVPPEGYVASVEPLDLTQMLAKAAPSLEDVQQIIKDLKAAIEGMKKPEGDFVKITENFRDIVAKINQGKGSLGMLVNDAALYREVVQTADAARKVLNGLEQSKGLLGTLLSDQKFKGQVEKTVSDLRASLGNIEKASGDLKEASARLPDMSKNLDSFLQNLNRAGKGLPGLVTEGETMVSEADKTAKAAQKSWFLRKYVPKPKERTIRLDADPAKD